MDDTTQMEGRLSFKFDGETFLITIALSIISM